MNILHNIVLCTLLYTVQYTTLNPPEHCTVRLTLHWSVQKCQIIFQIIFQKNYTPFVLYIILFSLFSTILFTGMYTLLYTILCTALCPILYTKLYNAECRWGWKDVSVKIGQSANNKYMDSEHFIYLFCTEHYTVHFTLYIIQCTLYTLHCYVHCTLR